MEGGYHQRSEDAGDVAEMELYFLTFVFSWELSYETPYDFIKILTQKISQEQPQFGKNAAIIETKALQISELLLICIFARTIF